MKAFTLLIICIVSLSSCIKEKIGETTVFRTVKNSSSHSVDFMIYSDKQSSYRLEAGDSITFQGNCTTGFGPKVCSAGWSDGLPASAKIIFDEEKELYYPNGGCENGRNPVGALTEFDLCGYVERKYLEYGEYIYTIDDADYALAIPIVN
jgi:hypothetical protein